MFLRLFILENGRFVMSKAIRLYLVWGSGFLVSLTEFYCNTYYEHDTCTHARYYGLDLP